MMFIAMLTTESPDYLVSYKISKTGRRLPPEKVLSRRKINPVIGNYNGV